MNYGKNGTICCKRSLYLLICNKLSCIDQGNQFYNDKYNGYNYSPAAIKFQCIFTVQLFSQINLCLKLKANLDQCPRISLYRQAYIKKKNWK